MSEQSESGDDQYKDAFDLHAETLIEGAERMLEAGEHYDEYLASEMLTALEDSDVEVKRYAHLQEEIYTRQGGPKADV